MKKTFEFSKKLTVWTPIITLCVSFIIWFNRGFFVPGTFINYGDTMFPLIPARELNQYLYAWSPLNQFGTQQFYFALLLPYLTVYLLSKIGFPLWIINRLWVILPLALVGWATSYLFLSFYNRKYKETGALISSVFAMLTPLSDIYPFQYLSLAGFAFVFGAAIRLSDEKKKNNNTVLILFLGIALLLFTQRYFYLTAIVIILYLLTWSVSNKNKVIVNYRNIINSFIIAVSIFSFILLPLLEFFLYTKGHIMNRLYSTTPSEYDTGLHLWSQYKDWVNPFWTLRLVTSNPNHPVSSFMHLLTVSILSFIMPIFAFFALLLTKSRKVIILTFISIVFMTFAIAPESVFLTKIYHFLWDCLPGFSMFKAPVFFLYFLGILYAVLTGITTALLLRYIDISKSIFRTTDFKNFTKSLILFALFFLICFIYGGGLLIGKSPKNNVWGDIIYANHVPSIKYPDEYLELRNYLVAHGKVGERILNLPWTMGGYVSYKWWPYYNMPEVLNFLSPISVLGSSFPPLNGFLVEVANLIKKNELLKASEILKNYSINFILIHKDYLAVKVFFDPDKETNIYIENLSSVPNMYDILINNRFFILLHLKEEYHKLFEVNN